MSPSASTGREHLRSGGGDEGGGDGRRFRARLRTLWLRWRSRSEKPVHVLMVDTANWAGIKWNKVLDGSYWARRLYAVDPVDPRALIDGARTLPDCEPSRESEPKDAMHATFHGYSLWELCKTGILASLEQNVLSKPLDERSRRVVEYYYQQMRWLIAGIEQYFETHRVDLVIVSQGGSPMTRPFVEIARSRGCNVLATENSFLGDYVICDNATGLVVNRHRASRLAGDILAARPLTLEERTDFRARYHRARGRKLEEHRTGPPEGIGRCPDWSAAAAGRRIAVFLGQVMTDASVLLDGHPFFTPVDLMVQCLDFFRDRPEWFVVVRLHPKEANGCSWANTESVFGIPPGEPPGPLPYRQLTYRRLVDRLGADRGPHFRIVADAETSTDELMDAAEMGITINSQAGLEMALKYKRVVVCGDAFYARKGFTFDVGDPVQLASMLEKALAEPALSDSERHAADRYGRYLLDDFLFPRNMRGAWSRFFRLLEGMRKPGIREEMVSRAVAQLEQQSEDGTLFA